MEVSDGNLDKDFFLRGFLEGVLLFGLVFKGLLVHLLGSVLLEVLLIVFFKVLELFMGIVLLLFYPILVALDVEEVDNLFVDLERLRFLVSGRLHFEHRGSLSAQEKSFFELDSFPVISLLIFCSDLLKGELFFLGETLPSVAHSLHYLDYCQLRVSSSY